MLIAKLNLDTAAERLQKAAGERLSNEQRADAAVELAPPAWVSPLLESDVDD